MQTIRYTQYSSLDHSQCDVAKAKYAAFTYVMSSILLKVRSIALCDEPDLVIRAKVILAQARVLLVSVWFVLYSHANDDDDAIEFTCLFECSKLETDSY